MNEQETSRPEDALSGALESLFSDPQARERFEKIVASLKGNMQTSPAENATEAQKTTPMSTGSDGLSAILSNPALMENLPSLLAGMRPAERLPESAKTPEDRRRDLLLALKPFLSKDRGSAVDLILQISRLGAVLHMMG